MAKRDGAATRGGCSTAAWCEQYEAAHRAAQQEITNLPSGEAMLYHEGNLATDAETDPAIAGRAAAFRDAVEAAQGVAAQHRLGFERYQYFFWRTGR